MVVGGVGVVVVVVLLLVVGVSRVRLVVRSRVLEVRVVLLVVIGVVVGFVVGTVVGFVVVVGGKGVQSYQHRVRSEPPVTRAVCWGPENTQVVRSPGVGEGVERRRVPVGV